MTIIILAGGLGTRLKSVVQDLPKPMAPVNGKPFLVYLLEYVANFSPTEIILSVGYKWETIQAYFGDNYKNIPIFYCVEKTPLGTGGGIKKAVEMAQNEGICVLNGDTFFEVNLAKMQLSHQTNQSDLTIAVRKMKNFDRYGTILFGKTGNITNFAEKQAVIEGYINGGIYFLRKSFLLEKNLPEKFSFETEIMEKGYKENAFFVYQGDENEYFIDIGIPEDYAKVQVDFSNNQL